MKPIDREQPQDGEVKGDEDGGDELPRQDPLQEVHGLDIPPIPLARKAPPQEDETLFPLQVSPGGSGARALGVLAVLSLAGYAALAIAGDLRPRLAFFLGCWILLSLLYIASLLFVQRSRPTRSAVGVVLGGALCFRLTMLLAPPTLSEDIHRYVRDGWVQVNGHNPYLNAPDDPALASLRLPDHSLINNPSIPTLYPPLAEALFAAAAFVRPSVFAVKCMLALFESSIVLLLLNWLRRSDRNPLGVIVYAWHPLAIVEGVGSGHVDVLGAMFLVLAVLSIIEGRKIASSAWLAASALAKLAPLLLLPFFARRWKLLHVTFFAAILIAASGPYIAGAGTHCFEGLGHYFTRWEFNGSIYPLLEAGIDRLQPTEPLKDRLTKLKRALNEPDFLQSLYRWLYPPYLARGVAAALLLLVVGWIAISNMAPEREIFLALAAMLLLSPTLHPWYLLWILPFFVLLGAGPVLPAPERVPRHLFPQPSPGPASWSGPAWLWLSLAVPLSYLALPSPSQASAEVPLWARLVEYAPMVPLALLGRWSSTRRHGGAS